MTDTRPLACRNCRFSVAKDRQLWCEFWHAIADRVCSHFSYEPGTD